MNHNFQFNPRESAKSAVILLLFAALSAVAPSARAAEKAGDERDDNALKLKLVYCPPGKFTMGSPKTEANRDDEETQITVTLTKGFWQGQFTVTQSQWKSVMSTTPWKGKRYVKEGADFPTTYVCWNDAQKFCKQLTDSERKAGRLPAKERYDLPTEAQWEYACRAGTTTAYSFGDDAAKLRDYGWFAAFTDGSAKGELFAHQVGQKKPNAWGLYDMHGNVWQWCRDAHIKKLPGGSDPYVAAGPYRVLRGGGWYDSASLCRAALRRYDGEPTFLASNVGFRIVRVTE